MSEAMKEYRRLEERLIWMRWLERGGEAPGEEDLLEEMSEAWTHLSDHEQQLIRREGPKSLIAPVDTGKPHHHLYESLDTSKRHRFLKEAA